VPALPSVSVVAPTFRRRRALPGFIEPLLREPALTEFVIAVDGSDDGSVEWLQERARDDSRIVVLDLPNRGAGGARQAGVEAATCDVVLLMDDDVIASPGLVEGHARHHVDLEPRLVLGYMPNDWRALPHGRRGIAWIYRAAYESHVARYVADPESVLHGMWGGNLSMPREKLLEVGIQKLAVKRGQDDREFGLRCLKAGVQGAFDPSLHSVHLYDRDLAAFRRDCRVQGESRRMIHEVHDDLLGGELVRDSAGPETPDDVGLGLPGPLRTLWPALAGGAAFEPAMDAMEQLFALAVRERHLGLEVFAARGIGSLETMHGVVAS
jgi:glycosyltransferase involved in cell wall biosynthesis